MQPLDPQDPRRPGVKVAASIRAAILSGELEPGERLPGHKQLAESFGVAVTTVSTALRKLETEGLLTITPSGGTWVRDQAAMPVPEGTEHELAGTAAFLFEMGTLKHTPRTGWQTIRIPDPESVAEHSFRVALVGTVLAAIAGADPSRTAALCVFHDGHESRVSDINGVGRAYLTTVRPEVVTAHQMSAVPYEVGKVFAELTAEYEAGKTLEAQLARDADKLETLLQAREYEALGYRTKAWQDSSMVALRTDAGKQLAQAINAADPDGWLAAFHASYHELRKATRGRAED
jgi:5'-deoxynucleotidase YfbR-like HD superfamily hydrolase